MKTEGNGLRALLGCSAAIFWPGSFIFGLPGVMGPYWQDLFQVGRGAIGNIMFFVLAAVGLFMFFVGKWQESLGIRRMISFGVVLGGSSLFLIASATDIFVIYLWAFLTGAASCFVYIPALTTVQRWYPSRRGLVSGVVNLMFGLSAAIMAPFFGYLLELMGYRLMVFSLGATALIVGTTAAQFTAAPGEAVLAGSQSKPSTAPKVDTDHSLSVSQSLRNPSFWFLWTTWALQGSAGIAMVTLSTLYGLSKGLALESAVIILTAFNLASGLSRLITGYASDFAGRNFTMSVAFVAAGMSYFFLPYMERLLHLAILASIIGFAFGTLFAVSAPLVVDCFGIRHFGSIFGLVFTAYGFLAGLLGPSLSGYLLDATDGNFSAVFTYLGLFCVVSGVLIRFVIPRPCPQLGNE